MKFTDKRYKAKIIVIGCLYTFSQKFKNLDREMGLIKWNNIIFIIIDLHLFNR